MLYVDLDNTLLDSAGRLVDYDGGYRPLCQGSYVLRSDLLACFGDPEFYVPGSIGVNRRVADFGVVRHTYNEGLFPLDRYVACANYLVDSLC